MATDDDMVISVDLRDMAHTPREYARQERRVERAERQFAHESMLARLARRGRRMALTGAARRTALMAARGVRGVGGMVGRGIGRLAAQGAVRMAAVNPVTLAVSVLAIIGVAAGRIISGKPFEGVGEEVNQLLLGDMDEEARAKMAVRNEMAGDQHLARIRAQSDKGNSQLKAVYDDLYKLRKRDEDGASLMRREFPSNNLLDMMILRAWSKLWQGFRDAGGFEALDKTRKIYQSGRNATPGGGAR